MATPVMEVRARFIIYPFGQQVREQNARMRSTFPVDACTPALATHRNHMLLYKRCYTVGSVTDGGPNVLGNRLQILRGTTEESAGRPDQAGATRGCPALSSVVPRRICSRFPN